MRHIDLIFPGTRVKIRAGWYQEGKKGTALGMAVSLNQEWVPLLWDDEEDPTFHKLAGLDVVDYEVREVRR